MAKSHLTNLLEKHDWRNGKSIAAIEGITEAILEILLKTSRDSGFLDEAKVITHDLRKPAFLLYFKSPEEVYDRLKQSIEIIMENAKTLACKDIIQKVKRHIDMNISENLQTEILAQHFFISSSYLSAVFKKKMNMTISAYIEGVRMEKAKQILKYGACNVADAAMAVGYPDANYFCKVFKRYAGITPSKYRMEKIKDYSKNNQIK